MFGLDPFQVQETVQALEQFVVLEGFRQERAGAFGYGPGLGDEVGAGGDGDDGQFARGVLFAHQAHQQSAHRSVAGLVGRLPQEPFHGFPGLAIVEFTILPITHTFY